jgi:hypothetical protein
MLAIGLFAFAFVLFVEILYQIKDFDSSYFAENFKIINK